MTARCLNIGSTTLAGVLLLAGSKLLWIHRATLTVSEVIYALVILVLLAASQIRIWKVQRDGDMAAEQWRRELLYLTLMHLLMLGFGLWLATDLLKH